MIVLQKFERRDGDEQRFRLPTCLEKCENRKYHCQGLSVASSSVHNSVLAVEYCERRSQLELLRGFFAFGLLIEQCCHKDDVKNICIAKSKIKLITNLNDLRLHSTPFKAT